MTGLPMVPVICGQQHVYCSLTWEVNYFCSVDELTKFILNHAFDQHSVRRITGCFCETKKTPIHTGSSVICQDQCNVFSGR